MRRRDRCRVAIDVAEGLIWGQTRLSAHMPRLSAMGLEADERRIGPRGLRSATAGRSSLGQTRLAVALDKLLVCPFVPKRKRFNPAMDCEVRIAYHEHFRLPAGLV